MTLFATLFKTLLPGLKAELVHQVIDDLKAFARSQVVAVVIPQVARVLTKGIDGLVRVFAEHLEPPDAHRMTHGVLDEFQRQVYQLAESLRVYADAAYQVEAGNQRKDDEAHLNSLRNVREKLRKDVEGELQDAFTVLTGGKPED